MFGSNRSSPPAIGSYAEAVRVYDSIKPVRGRDPVIRPLALRSNWNLTIRTDGEDNLIVKLYHTDVVTYRKDGHIVLKPYGSQLTNSVAGDLLWGTGVWPLWKRSGSGYRCFTEASGRIYYTPNFADIFDRQLVAGAEPVNIPRVDRKKLNAALREYKFNEFSLWLRTMDKLGATEVMRNDLWSRPSSRTIVSLVLEALPCGPDAWPQMIYGLFHCWSTVDSVVKDVRDAIVRGAECIRYETVEWFDDYRQMDNAVKAVRRLTV